MEWLCLLDSIPLWSAGRASASGTIQLTKSSSPSSELSFSESEYKRVKCGLTDGTPKAVIHEVAGKGGSC